MKRTDLSKIFCRMFLTAMLFFLSGRVLPIAAQEHGGDELRYKGQLSAWTGWSSQGLTGARYIPQLNLEVGAAASLLSGASMPRWLPIYIPMHGSVTGQIKQV
jgi:hypothetical protein